MIRHKTSIVPPIPIKAIIIPVCTVLSFDPKILILILKVSSCTILFIVAIVKAA